MRRQIKRFLRTARDSEAWPVVLLLFAVLAPAVSLLWFMGAAMRNERLASKQRITDLARGHLGLAQSRIETFLDETAANLARLAKSEPPAIAFAKCVQSGVVDSLIILDDHGRFLYPDSPARFPAPAASNPGWARAGQLEYPTNAFLPAAALYHSLAQNSTNVDLAARGFQAEARCLLRAGKADDVVGLITEVFSDHRYDRAIDPQGRLIAANAELLALELITKHGSELFTTISQRLAGRVLNYENPRLAASQRRFLMRELRALSPGINMPTLAAEDLAAQFQGATLNLTGSGPGTSPPALQRTQVPDIWQLPLATGRVLALFHTSRLIATLTAVATSNGFPAQATLLLLPPTHENETALVSIPAGTQLPGWRLALSLRNESDYLGSSPHPAAFYLQIGLLVLAAVGVLTLLAVRVLRRQTALARLKNDLAATVSHELKTPLASMRVLIDTLLASEKWDEETARDYLRLISSENQRLSRLIQNFLTFSRMQRKRYSFQFSSVPPAAIIDAAVQSIGERFSQPGCQFEVQVPPDLPFVRADPDALASALINLLENAWKFSAEPRRILLSVSVQEGSLVFSVQDNGMGLSPAEADRIFEPFYQVDQRLSRNGSGCGLGLGIVQFIVTAHAGRVTVQSTPGVGSTFAISLPITAQSPATIPEMVT